MMYQLSQRVRELAVFEELWKDPVIEKFFNLMILASKESSEQSVRIAYTQFAGALYRMGQENWSEYLADKVLTTPTCCMQFAARDNEVPRLMLDAAMNELDTLSRVGALGPRDFFSDPLLPAWFHEEMDLQAAYLDRLIHLSVYGSGDFARHTMFRVEETERGDFHLKPIAHPDPITFEDLIGYQRQHEIVIHNTEILLGQGPASNILLYGDAGTGKSATVKAVVNLFGNQGLRLIEIGKNCLHLLPDLLDELSDNPLKFIIFIDDLSFQDNDDDFSALKAVLEGSVAARSKNTVIYATSNRRHLVRETFSAREGDDVHRNDTMQETVSLSERFGIKILFDKPNADQYHEIVLALAEEQKIDLSSQELRRQAEQFALHKSGRSARAARQFVDQLAADQKRKQGNDANSR